ncbi:MAG: helix-turn-helix domain-containing protein [Defluviitaleaceae bacterium]|nr:helix-turn-helix domain-containing protein [Defluviitaleaceae bacterium]MCL2274850.1 helix-turn-helix domain-containing protein [Defluviitaleaceae bacterium]
MKLNYIEIGARISSRRKELHMTQEKLTEKINMSINQLSNIENSHSLPTIETLMKLCEALRVTPDYFLLGVSHGKSTEASSINAITQKALLCTEKQQGLINAFISLLIAENY